MMGTVRTCEWVLLCEKRECVGGWRVVIVVVAGGIEEGSWGDGLNFGDGT